jgi:hypothetical protein
MLVACAGQQSLLPLFLNRLVLLVCNLQPRWEVCRSCHSDSSVHTVWRVCFAYVAGLQCFSTMPAYPAVANPFFYLSLPATPPDTAVDLIIPRVAMHCVRLFLVHHWLQ